MTPMKAALLMIEQGVIAVHSDGSIWKIRNLNTTPLAKPRRLETKRGKGYLQIKVCIDKGQFAVWAHRLVWTVIHGPIPPGLEPNHRDGDKTNNHPENLELVTRGENHMHAYRTGLRHRTNYAADMSQEAKALRARNLSYSAIARALSISQTTAFRAVRYPSGGDS